MGYCTHLVSGLGDLCGKHIAVQRTASLVHGGLTPATGMVPECRPLVSEGGEGGEDARGGGER